MSRSGVDVDRIGRLYELLSGAIAGFYEREGPPAPNADYPGQGGVAVAEVVILGAALTVETIGKSPPAIRAQLVNELMGALEAGLRPKGFTVNLPRVDDIPNPTGPVQ